MKLIYKKRDYGNSLNSEKLNKILFIILYTKEDDFRI